MGNNFAGQNLNGRSFRGQDLRGADFSNCQLKNCDFTDADLTGAKFFQSIMEENKKHKFTKLIVALVYGMLSASLAVLFNYSFVFAIDEIYRGLTGADAQLEKNHVVLLIGLLYAVSLCLSVLASIKYHDWRIAAGYYLLIIIAIAAAGGIAGARAAAGIVSGMGAVAIVMTVATAGSVVGSIVLTVVIAVMTIVVIEIAEETAVVIMITGTAIIIIITLLGRYLNRCALQSEEPMLRLLRRYALAWRCWGGTQFSGTMLKHTDFTEADLTAARFTDAKFHQPNFTRAKNLYLAWTYATPLEHKQVRTLLTEGTIDNRDFSNLNLRGLSFKRLNLSNCNFYHADLSEADFSGCDLTDANFSKAMVYGARFSHATMTGAIIDNWGMDKQTQFDDVVCEFVYTQRDRSERNPPDGTFFKPGEFSKLYQEIANTVDFIAHSRDELTALLRAIDSIKRQGGDLVIQSLERKNESVVIRTQSSDTIDKAAIYAEVKEQMAKEMNLLQQEHEKQLLLQKLGLTEAHHQRETELRDRHDSLLAQFINKAIENPKVEIMNDNSRRIEHASINHSAVNLGDASTVSNHIEQVADAELRTALQALQQLLVSSHLPAIDKQEAHNAVNDLAVISHKPKTERKSLAQRSLAFLKDLQQDLSSAAELGEQYGKLLVKVMAWF